MSEAELLDEQALLIHPQQDSLHDLLLAHLSAGRVLPLRDLDNHVLVPQVLAGGAVQQAAELLRFDRDQADSRVRLADGVLRAGPDLQRQRQPNDEPGTASTAGGLPHVHQCHRSPVHLRCQVAGY